MTKLLAARQIVTSMVTGILLWCVIGIGVSVLVSATLVLGYALFIVKDALAPAALSGAVQGLWLYLARNRWSGKKELVWLGIISGAALGLLDFAPAYVTTTACFGWGHIFLFVIAALAGGSSAGYVNSQVHLAEVRSPAPAAWKGRVALGVVLFLCAAGFEYVHYGVRLLERFPALGLSEPAVIDLNAGNAQGTARSGNYEYSGQFHRSCVVGSEGGVMEISQNDGKIQVYAADMWLKGGIDGNGEFWAGGQRTSAMDRNSMLRHLLTGRFRNESQFQYSLRSSLIINGSIKNTTMESGAGRLLRR